MSLKSNSDYNFQEKPERDNSQNDEVYEPLEDADSRLMDSVDRDIDFSIPVEDNSGLDSQNNDQGDSVRYIGEPGLEPGSNLEQVLTDTHSVIERSGGLDKMLSRDLKAASQLMPLDVSAGSDADGNFKELKVSAGNGQEVTSQIYESGMGKVTAGSRSEPFDFSSADKIYQSIRSRNGSLADRPVQIVSSRDMPNSSFRSVETLATGMQRVEMANGDVLYRPPPNPENVKWIRAVGGDKGNVSIVAYTNGTQDLRFDKPQFNGIQSARFDQLGQLISVRSDGQAPGIQIPGFGGEVQNPADFDSDPTIQNYLNAGSLDRTLGYSTDPRTGPVGDLANTYLTSENKAARERVVEQLTESAESGNSEAKNALDTLEIRRRIEGGMRLLSQIFESKGPIPPSDRLAWIGKNQGLPKGEFLTRNHETVGLIVDHYNFAGNEVERQQALSLMRREVQLGDQTAVLALQLLSTADAGFKLVDASKTLNDPDATPFEKQQAQEQKMAALKELARQEISERIKKQDVASGYLDQLDKRPALGVTREDIAQARQEARQERLKQGRATSESVRQALEGSPEERTQALQDLQRLSESQQFNAEPERGADHVKVAGLVSDTMDNINQPEVAADSLLNLGLIEGSSKSAGRLLENLRENGDQGEELYNAIKSGDKTQLAEFLEKPEYKKAIEDSFQYMKDWSERIKSVEPDKVLELIQEDPEYFEAMLEEAREEDERNREKVDGLAGDYLLRESQIKPARDVLNELLPDEDRAFTAGDISDGDRQTLQDAIDLEHLPEGSREQVKQLLEGKELSREQVADLRRNMNRSEAERRGDALESLNEISFDNLHLTTDFEDVKRALVSLDNTEQVHKTARELKQVLGSDQSTEEEKSRARRELLEELKEMRDNAEDLVHPLSTQYVREFQESSGSNITDVIENLESGDNDAALNIADLISGNLPESRDQANEYRALRVVGELEPSSSPEDFNLARRRLESEITSSRIEEGVENKDAIAWRDWARSNQSVSEISRAGMITPLRTFLDSNAADHPLSIEGQDSGVISSLEAISKSGHLPEKSQEILDNLLAGKEISVVDRGILSDAVGSPDKQSIAAVDDLVSQAEAGNQFARTALAAVLVSEQDLTRITGWLDNHARVDGDKPIYVPDASGLSRDARDMISTRASAGLLEFSRSGRLSLEETSAVALALSAVSAREAEAEAPDAPDASDASQSEDKLTENLAAILNNGVDGRSQTAVLEGIFEAFSSGAKGTEPLAEIYLKGVENPLFAEHFDQIVSNAKSLDRSAIRVLAGITAGMADKNREANPMHAAFLGDGTDVSWETNSISKRAVEVLEDLAKRPGMKDKVAEDLLHISDLGSSDPRFIDRHRMLGLLGKLAGSSSDTSISDRALTAIRDGVDRTRTDRNSDAHRSAIEGLFGMSSHLDISDVDRLTSNVSDQVVRGLRSEADSFPPEVRDRLAATFEATVRGGTEVDFDKRIQSVLAMGALGKHLNSSQVRLLASFGGDQRYSLVSQNLRAGLQEFNVKPEVISEIVEAEAEGKDLAPLLESAGLSEDQTRLIENVVSNTTSGDKILSDLSMNAKQVEQFKAAVAQSLLSVLAKAPSESFDRIGPKEIAYDAFKNVAWPMSRWDMLEHYKDDYIASRDSKPLRDALIHYFEGKPFQPELAQEINRIVDGAMLPRPAAALLMNMGIKGTDYRFKKAGDPDTVFEIADKIKENYSQDGRSGEDVLREVVSNIEMINSLPGDRRAQLMGWDKLSPEEKRNMGWFEEPPEAQKQSLQWDQMTEAQKERIRWSEVKVNQEKVVGQMYNGELAAGSNAVLLSDLNATFEAEQKLLYDEVDRQDSEIERLIKVKEVSLDKFVDLTKGKGSFGNKVAGFFTLNNGIDSELDADQRSAIRQINAANELIEARIQERGEAENQSNELELSQDVKKYTDLLNSGDQYRADQLALRMFEEHGTMLSKMAPSVWADLTVSRDSSLQGASILKRMRDRGQVQFEMIPGYSSGDISPDYYDTALARQGFSEALGLSSAHNNRSLIELRDSIPESGDGFKLDTTDSSAKAPFVRALRSLDVNGDASKFINSLLEGKQLSAQETALLRESLSQESYRGLIQLAPEGQFKDTAALRNHMIGRLDQDRALKKFSDLSRAMSGDLNEFQLMYEAAMQGTVYDGSIEQIKERAERIKETLAGVSPRDLVVVADRIELMEKALTEMKSGDSSADPKAMEELQNRIDTFKKMHNMLDEDGPKYKEFATPDPENEGEYISQNQQIMEMLDRVTDGGLTASTATNWFKQNGPMIGATIVALGLTAAACATFGTASPAAAAAWFAVIGLAAREVTNEVLYQYNENGYSGYGHYDNKGAKLFDWGRNLGGGEFDDTSEALLAFGSDVALPYTLEIARDYAAFLLTAGLMNKFVGGMPTKQAFTSLFTKAPPNASQLAFMSQRAILQSQGRGVAGQFMKQFMGNFGKEMLQNIGMTGLQTGVETAVYQNLSAEQLEAMGEWGQFGLSFALSTTLAMGQGAIHSRLIQRASWQPGSKLRFELADGVPEAAFIQHMRKEGLNVEQISPGRWKVLPVGAGADMVPITMEMMERGEGRPPAELHPADKPLAKRDVGTLPEQVKVSEGEIWNNSPSSKTLREQAAQFNELFMSGKFEEAYKFATRQLGGNFIRTVEFTPRAKQSDPTQVSLSELSALKVKADAGDLSAQATLNSRMQDIMAGMSDPSVSSVNRNIDGTIVATVPRLKLDVDGVVVDFASGKVVRKVGTATDADVASAQQQVETFRNTPEGRRLLAEQALTAMEERIHLLHSSADNKVLSPTYAEFLRDTAVSGSEQASALKAPRNRTKLTLEQETILTLYESGWSLEHLEHHFAGHHKSIREPVFNYLRGREALQSIPDAAVRESVGKVVNSPRLSPEARAALYKDLPELVSQFDVKTLRARVDCLGYAHDSTAKILTNASENVHGASNQNLSAARESLDTLKSLIKNGEVSTVVADHIVLTMEMISRKSDSGDSTIMSSDTVRAMAKLSDSELDVIIDNLPNPVQKLMIEALNQGLLSPEALSTGLSGPETFIQNLNDMSKLIGLSKTASPNLSNEQLRQVSQLEPREQQLLQYAFESRDISSEAFDVLLKRMQGESSGSAKYDEILTPESVSGATSAQLKEAAVLISKHLDGTLGRGPEVIKQLLDFSPEISPEVSAMMQMKTLSSEHLNAIMSDLNSISDGATLQMAAKTHRRLAAGDPKLHQSILAIDDRTLMHTLMENYSADKSESLQRIVDARLKSPEMKSVIDELILNPRNRDDNFTMVSELVNSGLGPTEFSTLANLVRNGQMSETLLPLVLNKGSAVRANLIKLADSGTLSESAFARLVNHDHVATISESLAKNILDSATAEKYMDLLSADPEHAEYVKKVLEEQIGRSKPDLGPVELGRLLNDSRAAFDRYLDVPLDQHKSPELVSTQRELREIRNNLVSQNADASAIENLNLFIESEVAKVYESNLPWRREQLVDLVSRLKTMPEHTVDLVGAFNSNPLRYGAYMRNPELISKPLDSFIVVARGETKTSGNMQDWTPQYETAARYFSDQKGADRHLHLVVIQKDKVSPELWQWANESGTGMDINKKSPFVDQAAYNPEFAEIEMTCPKHLREPLREMADHYYIDLDK